VTATGTRDFAILTEGVMNSNAAATGITLVAGSATASVSQTGGTPLNN
jgi:hypothetical protein